MFGGERGKIHQCEMFRLRILLKLEIKGLYGMLFWPYQLFK